MKYRLSEDQLAAILFIGCIAILGGWLLLIQ
jgi:hypothetical protein